MKTTSEIRGTSALILGYGREGKSVEAWLVKHYPTMRIGIADTHETAGEEIPGMGRKIPGIKLHSGGDYLRHLADYDTVIRSPGISPYLPEIAEFVAQGGYMTSATNIFFSRVTGKTIGITGTKGKSTTTSLVAHILASQYPDVRLVGNIGKPMLDELDTATHDTIFVIELSSHQLADIRYSPHIAVLLDIVTEHLDYYPDFASYVSAKANIVKYQHAHDAVVYHPAHKEVAVIARRAKGAHHPLTISDVEKYPSGLLENTENIMAAVTVARLMEVPEKKIKRQLVSFTSLPHRLEFVGEHRGIRFYNDSLATIPQATIHALVALGSDVATLLVGGYDRHLDHSELGAYLRAHPVTTLILFPDTGASIWKSIEKVTRLVQQEITRHFFAASMEEAVRLAYQYTPKGKICLLSPASASYNMFRDYEDRGNQFIEWVRRLGGVK